MRYAILAAAKIDQKSAGLVSNENPVCVIES
nr:MAG TPA: hypothetical protein [Caudoviricetes sp.]